MGYTSFSAFGAALCACAEVPIPDLRTGANGVASFQLSQKGVAVRFVHADLPDNDDVFVEITFGPIPKDQELQALRVLAEANYSMVSVGAPVFGRNPASGDVVLRKVFSYSQIDARQVFESVVQLTDLACHWRENPTFAPNGDTQVSITPDQFA